MKAVSLWQPWASLVGRGKDHETRSWQTSYRGPIAIHAAKHWTRGEKIICTQDPFCRVLKRYGIPDTVPLPLGAIVATAILAECIPTERCITFPDILEDDSLYYINSVDWRFGDYTPGRFAWRLEAIRLLSKPILYRGAQGLFEIPDALVRMDGS